VVSFGYTNVNGYELLDVEGDVSSRDRTLDFLLVQWKTMLEEKLAFAASSNHCEKCLGTRKWCSSRESKHRL